MNSVKSIIKLFQNLSLDIKYEIVMIWETETKRNEVSKGESEKEDGKHEYYITKGCAGNISCLDDTDKSEIDNLSLR